MKPTVIVLGENRDYYGVDVSISNLKEGMSGIKNYTHGDELLNRLIDPKIKIPSNKLRGYGGTIPFTDETYGHETLIDGLDKFFSGAITYAQKHKAPFVLVQDVKVKGHLSFEIEGLV